MRCDGEEVSEGRGNEGRELLFGKNLLTRISTSPSFEHGQILPNNDGFWRSIPSWSLALNSMAS